jgi:hypothetical protein
MFNSNNLQVIGLVGLILTASYFVHVGPVLFQRDKWKHAQLEANSSFGTHQSKQSTNEKE